MLNNAKRMLALVCIFIVVIVMATFGSYEGKRRAFERSQECLYRQYGPEDSATVTTEAAFKSCGSFEQGAATVDEKGAPLESYVLYGPPDPSLNLGAYRLVVKVRRDSQFQRSTYITWSKYAGKLGFALP